MKIFFRTYGCRANQYDTEAVRAMLIANGAEETTDAQDADFAIFNSCTVTASAEADLRADVRAAAARNPSLQTIVMGCASGVPSRDEMRLPLATLPSVTTVIGGADIDAVAIAVGVSRSAKSPLAAPPTTLQTRARALLRIQDGCDEHCTFCATTIARGANKSRTVRSIVAEARELAMSHSEIVLTGIHIGTYGADRGSSLGELAATLIEEVESVRFRLSSVEATEVDDRLGELLTEHPARLAPHLHAPLQSGSNGVLRRMGRHWYTAETYEARVNWLTQSGKPFALSADVITGFPGETAADHNLTMRLVERLPFTSLHVFPYSARPGTGALKLHGAVAESVARTRARELRDIAEAKSRAYIANRAGGCCDVVVIERGKGLTGDYLSVLVPDLTIPRRARFAGVLSFRDGRLAATPGIN